MPRLFSDDEDKKAKKKKDEGPVTEPVTDETKVKKAKKKKKGKKKKRMTEEEGEEKEEGQDDGQNFTDHDLETFRLCGFAFLEIADHKYMEAWRSEVENFVVKVVQEISQEGYSQLRRRALAEEFVRLRPIISLNLNASGSNEEVPQQTESLEDVGDPRC